MEITAARDLALATRGAPGTRRHSGGVAVFQLWHTIAAVLDAFKLTRSPRAPLAREARFPLDPLDRGGEALKALKMTVGKVGRGLAVLDRGRINMGGHRRSRARLDTARRVTVLELSVEAKH